MLQRILPLQHLLQFMNCSLGVRKVDRVQTNSQDGTNFEILIPEFHAEIHWWSCYIVLECIKRRCVKKAE